MYKSFYSLTSLPFCRDTPVESLYMTDHLQERLSRLEYVASKQHFAVLTGDCGTGKTTLLRALRERLNPNRYKVLYISESQLTPRSFYRLLLDQLGLSAKWNRADAKRQLHERLAVLKTADNIDAVCIIDEGHLLTYEMLEEIRFLLNMGFDSVSPMSLILSGQNELRTKLSLEKCTAIRQRIELYCGIGHYDRSETGAYIRHQMSQAGATHDIFTEKALTKIYEYSTGIARVINSVCSHSLLYGSQSKMSLIDDSAVQLVLDNEFI